MFRCQGIVTFLFTDVEGSTTLWERHPVAMQAALARHDKVLRSAIASSNGLIVKTTGDGVFAVRNGADAFGVPRGATCPASPAADVAGRAPATSDTTRPVAIRVRMGLHSGTAELRDRDYFGPSLSRAARIMSAAHGEQSCSLPPRRNWCANSYPKASPCARWARIR
jgi:class 3 adenylate cyclase